MVDLVGAVTIRRRGYQLPLTAAAAAAFSSVSVRHGYIIAVELGDRLVFPSPLLLLLLLLAVDSNDAIAPRASHQPRLRAPRRRVYVSRVRLGQYSSARPVLLQGPAHRVWDPAQRAAPLVSRRALFAVIIRLLLLQRPYPNSAIGAPRQDARELAPRPGLGLPLQAPDGAVVALEHGDADPVVLAVLAPHAHGVVVAGAREDVAAVAAPVTGTVCGLGGLGTPGDGFHVRLVLVQHRDRLPVVFFRLADVLPDPHRLVAAARREVLPRRRKGDRLDLVLVPVQDDDQLPVLLVAVGIGVGVVV